jgi:hypothetical protein
VAAALKRIRAENGLLAMPRRSNKALNLHGRAARRRKLAVRSNSGK